MHETTNAPSWVCPAGTILGWRDEGVVRATGIRYARAARHAAPVAEPKADGLIEATAWAPACPQVRVGWLEEIFGGPMARVGADEHCQRLSVTVPPDAKAGDALPVMVWIHGGAYVSGAGDFAVYDPAVLVREQRVIVVSVTYRLGLFGYLGSSNGPTANLGLLDQIEALRWVRRNIAAFGGDPENVTIFGQSAGGDAVAHLMIARGAEGLFRRAIIQSAPFGLLRGRAAMIDAMLAEAVLIPGDAAAAEVVAAQARVLNRAKGFGLKSGMAFGVQYGLDPLPSESGLDEAWQAAAERIEVLVGCTDRELALYVPAVPALGKIGSVPGVGRFARNALVRALTWRIFGARAFARRHRRGGGRGYRYQITWGAPGNVFAGAHTVELPLLFGNQAVWKDASLVAGAPWAEIDRQGQRLRALWAGFARTGEVAVTHLPGLIRVKGI